MNADKRRFAVLKIPPAGAVLLRVYLAIRKQRRISVGRGQGNRITMKTP